jgi:hypothetical protein
MRSENLTRSDHAEDFGDNLLDKISAFQLNETRRKVLEAIAEAARGEYTEYLGRSGLKQLVAGVKARGRLRLLEKGFVGKQTIEQLPTLPA